MSRDAAQVLAAHRGAIWGLAYRVTGSAADADDVLQEVLVRWWEQRPDEGAPLRPWLMKVAVNAARDRLRKRRVRASTYVGPWLPEPVSTERLDQCDAGLEVRESAAFAFLIALEVLSPLQRAVWVLRDVFELSTAETAQALEITGSNAKVSLHRARQALRNAKPTATAPAAARVAMAGLFQAILGGNLEQAAAFLAADVQAVTDAGGHYSAATRAVSGPAKVARFLAGISKLRGAVPDIEEVGVNGGVGWWIGGAPEAKMRVAPRSLIVLRLDADGRVSGIFSAMNPDKLGAVPCSFAEG